MAMLEDILNAQAPGQMQRSTNRALAGGSTDGQAVWDDGSLYINAPGTTGTEPTEEQRLLVERAMQGDDAARNKLELQAALGDENALNALMTMDAFADPSAPSGGAINESTVRKAMEGDKAALDDLRVAAAMGNPEAANALNVIASTGQMFPSSSGVPTSRVGTSVNTPAGSFGGTVGSNGGASSFATQPASASGGSMSAGKSPSGSRGSGGRGGSGGGSSAKKPFKNVAGNPSSVPHVKIKGADYNKTPEQGGMGFDDLPPVKSSVKPPAQKGAGDKVHAYGNPHAKTGDVDVVAGKPVWKGNDGDNVANGSDSPGTGPAFPGMTHEQAMASAAEATRKQLEQRQALGYQGL